MKHLTLLMMSIFTMLFSFLGCKNKKEVTVEKDKIIMRYFLGNSALHKQKSDKGIYLYDEISKEDAEENQYERAYFVGFYRNDTLVGYQKIFRGEVLMDVSEISKTLAKFRTLAKLKLHQFCAKLCIKKCLSVLPTK